ncbi:ankyrin repeat domain-containing protein 17-like [Leptopilina heterotoma]|uniref:ankyrin repeat domain-containing protein 17-like n=1 Tax=Leptopilina heterotoma TaxID=63436 RepID=UPI001CA936A9|nr:ankyrin repeat domain-containing protein 17-like [Leptopilina heterotoma]
MDRSKDYDDTSDYNELFLAVHNGELSRVHSLLEKYSATETIRGRTLLHVATARGHAEIAKTLLGNGATIAVEDIKGNTPLDVSLAKGNVQMAEILFQHGAVLSDNDLTNMKPLRNAVGRGNFEMVKLLMANGCNIVDIPNNGDFFPKSSLRLAVTFGRLDILEYLMKNGVKNSKTVEKDKVDLFITVILEGSLDTLNFLVDIGIKVQDLDDVFNSTFYLSRYDMWKYLVTRLSKINANTYFKEKQLHLAIRMGQLETVKAIVNEPSNEYESNTFARKLAVYIAVESGSEEILEILLNAGYPADSLFKCISPLHVAATFEHPRLVKLLLEAGADVNLQTEDWDRTPLHFAATAAQPAVVRFLLNHGADPSITSKRCDSPLKTALKIHSGIIHILIPVTPSVFDGLVKVTDMLIQYLNSKATEDLFHYAVKMRVLSSISNSKPKSERLTSAVSNSVFRPEIVRCIFNYLSEEEVKDFSESFLFEKSDLSDYPPELFKLFVEYNIDLKSCFDIELYTSIKNIKHQLLLIGYSKNVPNLLGTISEIINDYDEDYYNDLEKKNIIEILKLLFCRLVLLITKYDRIELEECDLIDVIDWVEKCLKEKRVMQRTKVNKNLNFTFLDVLTKSMDKVVGYSNNEDFLTAIKSSQMKFPIYADFLKANVEIAERRRNCIDESTTLMYCMVKKCYKIQISTSDIRHMFKYLSIVDLQRFSAACS